MTYKSGMKIKVNIKHEGGTGLGFFKDLMGDMIEDGNTKDDAMEGALMAVVDLELAHSKANDLLNGDDDLFAADLVFLDNDEAEFTVKSWGATPGMF